MTISKELKAKLSELSYWQKMAGSQFVQGLSLLVEQIGERFAQRCERALQESRISTAVRRSSILAEAQDRGYVGRKVMPSIGTGEVKNKADKFLGLPIGTSLISNSGVKYITLDAVDLPAAGKAEVNIAQLELKVLEIKVDSTKPFFELLIPKEITAVAHRVDVYLKESDNAIFLPYSQTYMFRGANEQSKVYSEFYTINEQLGVRFGNGVFGSIPPQNSTIRLEVWCSLGVTSLMKGEKLSFVSDELSESCEFLALTPIVGGQPAESTEETKIGAMYATQYDNQIVWRDDYIQFLRSNLAGLAFLNVWGEEQQELQDGQESLLNSGVIFVSAYSQSSAIKGSDIVDLLKRTNYMNRIYRFVPPKITAIPLTFTGVISRTLSISDADSILKQAIESRYGLGKLPVTPKTLESDSGSVILVKDIWTLIDGLNVFTDFNVSIAGASSFQLLEEYRYIDIASSSIIINYGGLR